MTEKEKYNLNKEVIKELKNVAEIFNKKKNTHTCSGCPTRFSLEKTDNTIFQININLQQWHRDLCFLKCCESYNFSNQTIIQRLFINWINKNSYQIFNDMVNELERENELQKEKTIKELEEQLSELKKND